jgi:hypothetical protein
VSRRSPGGTPDARAVRGCTPTAAARWAYRRRGRSSTVNVQDRVGAKVSGGGATGRRGTRKPSPPVASVAPPCLGEASGDQVLRLRLRLRHDALDEPADRGDVVDQALGESGAPDAGLQVAVLEDPAPARRGHQVSHVGESAARVEDVDDLAADRVARHPGGVAQRAEDQLGVELPGGDDPLLDPPVHRGLLGTQEAGAHVDALRPQRERGGRDEDQAGYVLLAGVAGALEHIIRTERPLPTRHVPGQGGPTRRTTSELRTPNSELRPGREPDDVQ